MKSRSFRLLLARGPSFPCYNSWPPQSFHLRAESVEPIYLDSVNATRADPRVVEAMLPFLTGAYGNPASPHSEGRRCRAEVEKARSEIALLIGCEDEEIV